MRNYRPCWKTNISLMSGRLQPSASFLVWLFKSIPTDTSVGGGEERIGYINAGKSLLHAWMSSNMLVLSPLLYYSLVCMWRRIQHHAVLVSLNISSGRRILQLPAFQFERLMQLLMIMFRPVELMQCLTFTVHHQYIQVLNLFLLLCILASFYREGAAVSS